MERAKQLSSDIKISVNDVGKVFGRRDGPVSVLQGIDLEARDGEFVCIIGPSGCGKTTLLRICAGLERASTGTVSLRRDDESRPSNTMVFQEQSVFPWKTVRGNIEYGLQVRGVPKSERRRISDLYIERLGLAGFDRSYPHQLSGGMKQRVSIGRAFANDPEILLMDEPFANLDEQTRMVLQEVLLGTWQDTGKTVLFITHSLDEAIALGDRVVVMSSRPGEIKAEFRVDLPRPRSILTLKSDSRFLELVGQLWDTLRDEVTGLAEVADISRGGKEGMR
jgi:NitT/TauT family transport system ATP-binding protein